MTFKFKFVEPEDGPVIKLDPSYGSFETSGTMAQVEYAMRHTVGCPSVELNIRSQDFEAADVDDLIAFLECVRQRFRRFDPVL